MKSKTGLAEMILAHIIRFKSHLGGKVGILTTETFISDQTQQSAQ